MSLLASHKYHNSIRRLHRAFEIARHWPLHHHRHTKAVRETGREPLGRREDERERVQHEEQHEHSSVRTDHAECWLSGYRGERRVWARGRPSAATPHSRRSCSPPFCSTLRQVGQETRFVYNSSCHDVIIIWSLNTSCSVVTLATLITSDELVPLVYCL